MRRRLQALAVAVTLVTVASAAPLFLYRHTLDYGFDYDDYHFIRPHSGAELLAAFRGPWDATGIEVPFYRPLTIAFYALRFELFGLDSRAHHAVSLWLFAAAAALAGACAWRSSGRLLTAAAATAAFTAHPAMPYALVAWVTNQMHLVETLLILLALLWWYSVRARGAIWWLPLLFLAAAVFMVKEDGIMLLPSIVALHWIRRRTAEPDLSPMPRSILIASVALLALLLVVRSQALDGLGGYGLPTVERAWTNYTLGLNRAFRLVPPDRPWQPAASWFATLVPLAGAAALWRSSPSVRFLFAAGALIALAFNLPFIFVTKNEQMHLVALGASLVLAASATAVVDLFSHRVWRLPVSVALAAGLATFALVARHVSTDFAPFGPIVLSHDNLVKDWAAVPVELRQYLDRKLEPGAEGRVSPNPVEALRLVSFGMGSEERNPAGEAYRWMSQPSVLIYVASGVRRLDIPLRHEIGAFRDTVPVAIDVDGRAADAMELRDDKWHVSRITLPPAPRSGRMHVVRLQIPRVWRPSEVIPGSGDTRPLGLQVGTIAAR